MQIRSYDSRSITRIKINFLNADLGIQVLEDPHATITLRSSHKQSEDLDRRVEVYEQEETLVIQNTGMRSIFELGVVFRSARYKLMIPRNRSLSVHLLSGDLEIRGQAGEDNLNRKHQQGQSDEDRLSLKHLQVDQKSGDCALQSIIVGYLSAQLASGDIALQESYFREGKLRTLSGDITLRQGGTEQAELRTLSGNIEADLCYPFQALRVESKSGDIHLALPFKEIDLTANSLCGKSSLENVEIKNGAPQISCKTLSGDISIRGGSGATKSIILGPLSEGEKQTFSQDQDRAAERQKVLFMLLGGTIKEKEAGDLLKSLGFSQEEIDLFFEEYLLLKEKEKREPPPP